MSGERDVQYYGKGPMPDGVPTIQEANRLHGQAVEASFVPLVRQERAWARVHPEPTPKEREAQLKLLRKHGIIDLPQSQPLTEQ